ncbi:MAG: riboflavin synthase [Candidatus Cloacimonadaceae bacterium]
MFTGIIEAFEPVKTINKSSGKTLLTISRPQIFTDLKAGGSIACNGICLTVTEFDNASFTVEIMNETMQKTTANKWLSGEKLNLERALQVGSRLDGHWVQGHIDTTSALLETKTVNSTLYLTFALPAQDKALVVPQGSIAVNGVSLTIAELKENRFSVALIGHTLENTNLKQLSLGSKVNLEYDVIGKYILRNKQQTFLNQEFLHENGF